VPEPKAAPAARLPPKDPPPPPFPPPASLLFPRRGLPAGWTVPLLPNGIAAGRVHGRSGRRAAGGWTLVELLVVLAILAVVALLGAPSLLRAMGDTRMRLAVSEVTSSMRLARAHAVRHGEKVGLRFDTSGGAGKAVWVLYRDGDGDGVRADDIERGTDPRVRDGGFRRLGRAVRFGFPPGPPPRDPGDPRRRLGGLDDPIRFNRSDMASFDPLGTATPGSVYLTDGRERLAAVRITGRTGRMQVLYYDRAREVWSSR
jgi:prepilin-type N-terminal cleavage/methylation domain-containing protein